MARGYRDLLVWRKAKSLAIDVYRATEKFPQTESFGLTSQMRRAAISVPSNIAEGQGRGSRSDLPEFLCIARGALLELDTQLDIALELGMGSADELRGLGERCDEILGLLNRFLTAIEMKGGPRTFKL